MIFHQASLPAKGTLGVNFGSRNMHFQFLSVLQPDYSPSRRTQEISYQNIERATTNPRPCTGKENPNALCIFLCETFLISFFQSNFPNSVRTKIDLEESDLPRRILLFRGLRSFRGTLVRLENSFFYEIHGKSSCCACA